MPVRKMLMTVGGTPIGEGITWAYPDGSHSVHYRIPIYRMTVTGTDGQGDSVSKDFDVYRFGVQKTGSTAPKSVGLADKQTHTMEMWLPHYSVHSAVSAEMGAWKVYGDFLVHDGPDSPQSVVSPYATIGCIELCGPAKFDALNDLLISLSGLTSGTRKDKLNAIGNSGKLKISYVAATRPPLTPV